MLGSVRSAVGSLAIVAAMSVVLAQPVLAADAGRTYHGALDAGQFFCGVDEVATPAIDGVWNLGLSGSRAVVTLNVFYGDRHHMSFGWSGGVVESAGQDLVVRFGESATATIAGNRFSWRTPTADSCDANGHDSVVFEGPVGR